MKFLLAAAVLFIASTFSQAQEFSNLCFPIGTLKSQAAKHGEYPAFSFRDIRYKVTFTMYINPVTGSYTMLGVSDVNPEVECVASMGADFKPVIDKIKGIDS